MLKQIAVFCASSNKVAPIFQHAARVTGSILATHGMRVYYGGGKSGLMGTLADAVLAEKGEIIGVQPRFMKEQGWFHPGITDLVLVDTMAERKEFLFRTAEAVIALPGGCGTLDELLEAITLKQLGQFNGPVVIVNISGFFDLMLLQLERIIQEHFMREEHKKIWQVINSPDGIIDALQSAPNWPPDQLFLAQL